MKGSWSLKRQITDLSDCSQRMVWLFPSNWDALAHRRWGLGDEVRPACLSAWLPACGGQNCWVCGSLGRRRDRRERQVTAGCWCAPCQIGARPPSTLCLLHPSSLCHTWGTSPGFCRQLTIGRTMRWKASFCLELLAATSELLIETRQVPLRGCP